MGTEDMVEQANIDLSRQVRKLCAENLQLMQEIARLRMEMDGEPGRNAEYRLGAKRYAKVRRMKPDDFKKIWRGNIVTGQFFDAMVDEWEG